MTEKRFKEIISTQKVIDTVTNKVYDCLLDNDLFDLINTIADENEQLKSSNMEYEDALARLEEKLNSKEKIIKAYDQFYEDLKKDGVLDD